MKNNILRSLLFLAMNTKGNFLGEGDPEPGPTPGGEPSGVEYKYPESLDKEYHGNPTLLKYSNAETGEFNQAEIMKALIHSTKHIGANKMVVPGNDSDPAEWTAAFRKLGLPEDIKDYKVENNIPEGMEANEAMIEGFKKVAHESGILPKQAQGVIDFFNTTVLEQGKAAQEASKSAYDESVAALKGEWGDNFESRKNNAFAALKEFADDATIKELQDAGLINSTAMVKVFDKIAQNFSEDSEVFNNEFTKNQEMDLDDIQAEIREMYKEDHPRMNKGHPHHAHASKRFMELMEKKVALEKKQKSTPFM